MLPVMCVLKIICDLLYGMGPLGNTEFLVWMEFVWNTVVKVSREDVNHNLLMIISAYSVGFIALISGSGH